LTGEFLCGWSFVEFGSGGGAFGVGLVDRIDYRGRVDSCLDRGLVAT
jgi:hypothetical protein